ncbi:MAG: flagellar biosynthesis protein FlhF [Desulfobacterales bacterium]|jgi:flagellar biosynthesis protein FlhF
MMQIKRYEARDMTSALRLIKNELGPDAVILSARSLKKENKLLGLVKSVGVEVTAAVDNYDQPAASTEVAFAGALNAYRRYEQSPRPKRRNVRRVVGRRIKSLNDRKLSHRTENDPGIAAGDMLSTVFKHLRSQEVKRDLAAAIIARLNQRYAHKQLDTIQQIIPEIAAILRAKRRPAEVKSANRSNGRVMAVVGPTGVGKTTTIAKLAALHALEQHQSVALISIDSYRIGATAELKVYAQAMGIVLKTAATPAAFGAAVDECCEYDLILVDTPGLNPLNPDEIDFIKRCLACIDQLEIYLALSAMSKESDLNKSFECLNTLDVTGLIFTKLDESCSYGNLINFLSDHSLPLTYLTGGRQVPNAIESGSVEKIVERLLADVPIHAAVSDSRTKDPSVAQTAVSSNGYRFAANKNSDVFHRSDCKWTRKIKPKNLITFSTAETALMQEFMPCRDCRPDKHKPSQIGRSATMDSLRISNYS